MWETFKKEYHKKYESFEEDAHRFEIFVENLKVADERTENEKKAGGTATHGIKIKRCIYMNEVDLILLHI